ncbi:flagellar hook-basal body complex protein FliE [Novosphingobium sp. FSY-8]|uniref:Flagellar hook-basal body complex protein FliE n=1 Tax=Novosphingobium ovatum TaxID=1908523 RepID=A0ABW9XGA3_9SPHN|nr:flagellar hook-basal body complex protein FliE [Novosphingobium ovatum]NBC37508.1 flagellar hook-basal body complex protein FliE [Novosphingobium ovatum]
MSSVGGIGGLGVGGASNMRDIMQLRQQIIERSQVLQQVHAPQAAPAQGTAQGGFGNAVEGALNKVNATQKQAEALTNAYETGQTQDIAKVMLARQEASVGFEATLQVRNKLLSAYQDIMKFGV